MSVVLIRVPSWLGRVGAHPENVMAQLDMGYAVAGLERAGVTAHMLDLEATGEGPEQAVARLAALRPQVLVLHAITPAVPAALDLARRARARIPSVKRILAVGQHASVLPETLLAHGSPVDTCIRGEYEEKIVGLVLGIDDDPTGLAFRKGSEIQVDPAVLEVQDLDALPLPAHRLFMKPQYKVFHPTGVVRRWRWGFLMSSRGCPYGCVYCSPTLRNSYGTRARARSSAGVVKELLHLRDLGATVIHFRDDIFTLDRQRVVDLCQAIIASGFDLKWTAQTRPDRVDLELLRLMKRAGCASIYFGVESGSPRILEALNKGSTVEQVEHAFAWAREAGLFTVGFFMLGNPGETERDIELTHGLLMRVRPDIIQVAFFTPYPGSPVFQPEDLEGKGLETFSHYNMPSNHSEVSDAALRRWQRRLYLDFIFRSGFIGRTLRHQALPGLVNLDKALDLLRLSAGTLLRGGGA